MPRFERIQYNSYGGPDVMRLEDFELLAPGYGEVAVRVKFAAVNPIDWKLRGGQMKIVTGRAFPRAMGMDFSGIVTAVGDGVTRLKAGDAVFGLARFKESGALGQAVVTKETFLAKKPDSVSFEDAACLGTPGVTAWNGLIDKAKLHADQHVFINGCAGAVGEAAVQIARLFGAIVSGSCSARDMERAKLLGVQTVCRALREQRKLRITLSIAHAPVDEQVVWPIMLGFIESKRFIAAWCELDSRFRVIGMDDITSAEVLAERYSRHRRQLVKEWRAQEVRPCNSEGEIC